MENKTLLSYPSQEERQLYAELQDNSRQNEEES